MAMSATCYLCGNETKSNGKYLVCPSCGHIQSEYSGSAGFEEALLQASKELVSKNFYTAQDMYRELIKKIPGNADAQWGLAMATYGVYYDPVNEQNHFISCDFKNENRFFSNPNFQKITTVVFDTTIMGYYWERAAHIEVARMLKNSERKLSIPKVVAYCFVISTYLALFVYAIINLVNLIP